MPRVTSVTPSKRNASKVVIHVDGRAVATLSRNESESLGVAVDVAWDADLAALAAAAVAFETAFDQAMRMINRRRLSRAVVAAKLRERGHEATVIERAVKKLLATGALNDETLARDLIDEIDRTRPAGPGLKRAKLTRRGLGEAVIEKVVDATATPSSQLEDARRLIASRTKAMARLDETTRKRRLWGLLARRGFDEETIDAVLGQ
jgi:regulatory protein